MVMILGEQNSPQEEAFLTNAAAGSIDLLKGFVEQGVNVNVQDEDGRTALHKMAEAGSDVTKMRYLIEQGA
ncbi:MAG: ankyrin repeat domain-containing protein, partial [Alphaproteobacteria bacterium]|nr:ankyrin repeat domain-containing protein [Alphaproteobacteria bacterium]